MEGAVHGGVDDPDAVLLALGDGHLGVLASALRVDVGTVDEDVLGQRWACS